MDINVSVNDNFSSYFDENTGVTIYIDTFDHYVFDIRAGNSAESVAMGTITAKNDQALNEKVSELFRKYLEDQ